MGAIVPATAESDSMSQHAEDLDVLGRVGDTVFSHDGPILWYDGTKNLEIQVSNQSKTYDVLVSKTWVDSNIPYAGLINHTWDVETVYGEEYLVVSLLGSETPTTLAFKSLYTNNCSVINELGVTTTICEWVYVEENVHHFNGRDIEKCSTIDGGVELACIRINVFWGTPIGDTNPCHGDPTNYPNPICLAAMGETEGSAIVPGRFESELLHHGVGKIKCDWSMPFGHCGPAKFLDDQTHLPHTHWHSQENRWQCHDVKGIIRDYDTHYPIVEIYQSESREGKDALCYKYGPPDANDWLS